MLSNFDVPSFIVGYVFALVVSTLFFVVFVY